MKQVVMKGAPRRQVSRVAFIVAVGLFAVGLAIAIIASEESQWDRIGQAVLIAGIALFVMTILLDSLLPRFEVVPDGAQTRRAAALRWANREGGWLLRGFLMALVGSGVTLLLQRLMYRRRRLTSP